MQTDLSMWALLIGGTLLFCGACALFAHFGFQTGKRFQMNPGQTAMQRFFRSFNFWCPISLVAFLAPIVLAMFKLMLVGGLLIIPATYLFAVAIQLDPGLNRRRKCHCPC
jgi:hypothetical protein